MVPRAWECIGDAFRVYIYILAKKPVVNGASMSPSPYGTVMVFVFPDTLATCSRCPREIRLTLELGMCPMLCSSISCEHLQSLIHLSQMVPFPSTKMVKVAV